MAIRYTPLITASELNSRHEDLLSSLRIEELKVLSNKNRTFPCCAQHMRSLKRLLETKKENMFHAGKE
ncbi:MAG: hypothetical protein ABSD68_00515 [Candidatus Micrarchaeales archaeon]|jgi:hypothetical protein